MNVLRNFAVAKPALEGRTGSVVELLLQQSDARVELWRMTRAQAVEIVAGLMEALEPPEDAPDAGSIRVEPSFQRLRP